MKEYKANKIAADEKYKGKILVVTGTVINIDEFVKPYINLASESVYDIIGVQCEFDKDKKSELAKYTKGNKLKIKGRCKGQVINVQLEDSEVVQNLGKVTTDFDKDMQDLKKSTDELEKLQKELEQYGQ